MDQMVFKEGGFKTLIQYAIDIQSDAGLSYVAKIKDGS